MGHLMNRGIKRIQAKKAFVRIFSTASTRESNA